MRTTSVFLSILLLTGVPIHADEKEKEDRGYFIAGLSVYQEDFDHYVGKGIGGKLGYGFDFTDRIGFELSLDSTPPLDPGVFIESYERRGALIFDYSVRTTPTKYLTWSGIYSIPLEKDRTLFGKLGWSVYQQEIKAEINGASFSSKKRLGDPRVEFGIQFPVKENYRLNVSFSHVFSDDAQATGLSCYLLWDF
ncbi:MAG: outer membrane beta-barrel protein [Gammaproteobacteria bacterium]|nr:outer membrane beta-barrel protein [Gammaproteobacteria bacterium]